VDSNGFKQKNRSRKEKIQKIQKHHQSNQLHEYEKEAQKHSIRLVQKRQISMNGGRDL
jgi:hypothetical protein